MQSNPNFIISLKTLRLLNRMLDELDSNFNMVDAWFPLAPTREEVMRLSKYTRELLENMLGGSVVLLEAHFVFRSESDVDALLNCFDVAFRFVIEGGDEWLIFDPFADYLFQWRECGYPIDCLIDPELH